MKPSLREVLADSHIAAVAIAVLLFVSTIGLAQVLLNYTPDAVEFLATAIAIRGMPSSSTSLPSTYQLIVLGQEGSFLFIAAFGFAAATLLARWIFGAGPLRSLRTDFELLARRIHD